MIFFTDLSSFSQVRVGTSDVNAKEWRSIRKESGEGIEFQSLYPFKGTAVVLMIFPHSKFF